MAKGTDLLTEHSSLRGLKLQRLFVGYCLILSVGVLTRNGETPSYLTVPHVEIMKAKRGCLGHLDQRTFEANNRPK